MRADHTWRLLFALMRGTLLASGQPISLADYAVTFPRNEPNGLAPSSPRPTPARNQESTPSSTPTDALRSPSSNKIAVITIAAGLGILILVVGLLSAFRVGWRKGLEHHEKGDRKLLSAASTCGSEAPVPWAGEQQLITMSRSVFNSPFSAVPGGNGRHSFRPGGVYEIHGGPESNTNKGDSISADEDKGKAKEVAAN